jgi:hypothetical protein
MWTLTILGFGLAVDAFGRGALAIDGTVEGTETIQEDTHASTGFDIQIFDAARALWQIAHDRRFGPWM